MYRFSSRHILIVDMYAAERISVCSEQGEMGHEGRGGGGGQDQGASSLVKNRSAEGESNVGVVATIKRVGAGGSPLVVLRQARPRGSSAADENAPVALYSSDLAAILPRGIAGRAACGADRPRV